MRLSWRSFSVSANFTTRLEEAPWNQTNCFIQIIKIEIPNHFVDVFDVDLQQILIYYSDMKFSDHIIL